MIKSMNTLLLLVYEILNNNKNDLFMLGKLLQDEDLIKLISFYNGAVIKFPTIDEYTDSNIVAIVYYLMYYKKMSYKQAIDNVKSFANYPIDNSKEILKKVKLVKQELDEKINQLMLEL